MKGLNINVLLCQSWEYAEVDWTFGVVKKGIIVEKRSKYLLSMA
jgi:hypothetical protein